MNRSASPVDGGNDRLLSRLGAHAFGIIIVAALFLLVAVAVDAHRKDSQRLDQNTLKYLSLKNVDFGDPLDRSIFRESLRMFYPGQGLRNDSLVQAIEDLRQRQFTDPRLKTGNNLQGMTWSLAASLGGMYLQFALVYLVVLVLVYLAAQRIGIYRFVKMKQRRESYLEQGVEMLQAYREKPETPGTRNQVRSIVILFGKAIGKGLLAVIFFSPAYVIAYSLKTTFDTSSLLFMALLGIVSNGVLVHTANRFTSLLTSESQKGYVQTAAVKGLRTSYEWNTVEGIPVQSLVRIRGAFRSHVFSHIFLNARFQFIPALKEHASFLVTGLIIIEMALNIQGHLCYELLQQILYGQYDVACAIVFSIFLTVKTTEIVIDVWYDREKRKYGY